MRNCQRRGFKNIAISNLGRVDSREVEAKPWLEWIQREKGRKGVRQQASFLFPGAFIRGTGDMRLWLGDKEMGSRESFSFFLLMERILVY